MVGAAEAAAAAVDTVIAMAVGGVIERLVRKGQREPFWRCIDGCFASVCSGRLRRSANSGRTSVSVKLVNRWRAGSDTARARRLSGDLLGTDPQTVRTYRTDLGDHPALL